MTTGSSSDVASTPKRGSENRGSGMRGRTSSEHILRKAFKKYDRNGTGFIDAHDVSRMLIKLGEFSNNEGTCSGGPATGAANNGASDVDSLTLMAAEAEVALADRSARGKLSYDDFVAWFSNRASSTGSSNGTNSDSSLPAVNSVSDRVAAARQLLMQSWDGSPTASASESSPSIHMSPTRPSRGSPKRSPSRLRFRMPTSPSATGSPGGSATSQLRATPPSSPSKRQLKEIASKDKNGVYSADHIWIAQKPSVSQRAANSNGADGRGQENDLRDSLLLETGGNAAASTPLGLFQKFDTNKTGFLTRQQFAEMMVHLGLSFSSDDDLLVDAEMAMLGDERDRVSFQKWERWYSNLPSDR